MDLHYFRVSLSTGEKQSFLFPTLRIVHIVSGSCRWKIGDDVVHAGQGDILFLNNMVTRTILFNENLTLDIFEFPPDTLQGYPALLGAFYQTSPVSLQHNSEPLLNQTLDLLAAACSVRENSPFTIQLASAALSLMEDLFPTENSFQPNGSAFLAAKYIWQHYAEDLSVPAIAKELNISKSYLEASFKRVHGVGVGAYIRLLRLHNVRRLLVQSPDRSVLDIALSCGFQSSAGFYKAYKAVNGCAPRRSR